jgi:hypothetical protein
VKIVKQLLENKLENMFTEIEQEISDIDWFFTDNNNIAFVASAGGKLPNKIAQSENYNLLSSYFRSLPEKSEVLINHNLSKILGNEIDETYLSDFIFMAKKGLYCFDKSVLNNFSDTKYHLVAKPLNPIKMENLPKKILEVINLSVCKNNIEILENIDVIEI